MEANSSAVKSKELWCLANGDISPSTNASLAQYIFFIFRSYCSSVEDKKTLQRWENLLLEFHLHNIVTICCNFITRLCCIVLVIEVHSFSFLRKSWVLFWFWRQDSYFFRFEQLKDVDSTAIRRVSKTQHLKSQLLKHCTCWRLWFKNEEYEHRLLWGKVKFAMFSICCLHPNIKYLKSFELFTSFGLRVLPFCRRIFDKNLWAWIHFIYCWNVNKYV